MENPASWSELERTIAQAVKEWEAGRAEGKIGYSLPAYISVALRKAGLVSE